MLLITFYLSLVIRYSLLFTYYSLCFIRCFKFVSWIWRQWSSCELHGILSRQGGRGLRSNVISFRIDLLAVMFSMPKWASYSFHLFYQFFGKHDKSSVLSWKFRFWKKSGIEKDFHRISPQFQLDELIIWIRGYLGYSVIYSVAIYLQKSLL